MLRIIDTRGFAKSKGNQKTGPKFQQRNLFGRNPEKAEIVLKTFRWETMEMKVRGPNGKKGPTVPERACATPTKKPKKWDGLQVHKGGSGMRTE